MMNQEEKNLHNILIQNKNLQIKSVFSFQP